MRHKHYEVIVAWAEGKKIQIKTFDGQWVDWDHNTAPCFSAHIEHRIKPELKPDVCLYLNRDASNCWYESRNNLHYGYDVIKIIRDGETWKIKSAEVIK
jgi:hypothetical protein